MIKTRFWQDPLGLSSTAVQFRDDTDPTVHLHTNMGWVQIGNTPKDHSEAQKFAEDIAKGYKLEEANEDVAKYMLGEEDE